MYNVETKTIYDHKIKLKVSQYSLEFIIRLVRKHIIKAEGITEIREKLPLLDYLENELKEQNLIKVEQEEFEKGAKE